MVKKNKKTNSPSEFLFNNLLNSKRSQITIFVVLALIVVVAVALIYYLLQQPEPVSLDEENPQAYIESCVRSFTEQAIGILSEQGGDIVPEGSTMYKNKNISYLCYNANYYQPCINQRPLLIEHIENEITNYIEPKVDICFNSLKLELEYKNYEVKTGRMDLTTELKSKQVVVDINRDFSMTKNGKAKNFDNFKVKVNSPIYDLAEVATEVVNQEAYYCNFDILGFMTFYPQYDLNKFRPGNSDVIYSVREIPSNKRFVFAVRSCALPPGF
jgi:hypothetical protein